MLSIKKSVSKLFCLTLSNYSKKYNIHIYLPSSQEFDIINPNFINSAVFTSDSYCIPLIMKAKTSPSLSQYAPAVGSRASGKQLVPRGSQSALEEVKSHTTYVDQYLSRDPKTLKGTKITEALWRAFQTL